MRRNRLLVLLTIVMIMMSLIGCADSTNKNETQPNQAASETQEQSPASSNKNEDSAQSNTRYGARGAAEDNDLTLDEMLTYALQDEYLARAEYEAVLDEFGSIRPFSNIVKAEETHISLLKPLLDKYDIELPEDRSAEFIMVPASYDEALQIGVQAEINNIAMYEKLLTQAIPDEVKEVFTVLRDGSKNHLQAFSNPAGNAGGNGPNR